MTGKDYVDKIRQYIAKASTLDTETLLQAINTARVEHALYVDPLVRYVSFPFLRGQQEYSVKEVTGYETSKILKLLTVVVQLDGILQYEIPRGFKEDIVYRGLQGYPEFYYQIGDIIGFYPIPTNGMAILKLSLKPDDLSLVSEDVFDDLHQTAIVFLACSHVALATGDANLSSYFYERYRDHRQAIVTRHK